MPLIWNKNFVADQTYFPFKPLNFRRFILSRILHSHLSMATIHRHLYHTETIFSIKNDLSRYAWAGYLLFVLISSLLGDIVILIASSKYRAFNLHKVIVATIQNIAFYDLMVTITDVLPRFVSYVRSEWVFGSSMCSVTSHARYYSHGTGVLLICIMITSKLLLLKYPLRCEAISVKKAHMLCGVCWVAALILPLAALIVNVLYGQDIYFSYQFFICDYGFTADL